MRNSLRGLSLCATLMLLGAAGQRPAQLVFHRVGDTIEFDRPAAQTA